MDLKFKRQKPIGPYIADFVCFEIMLIIEADGGQHGNEADAKRDAWFKAQSFTVLRFWNNDILRDTDAVLEQIRQTVLALSPCPSPASGRGEQKAPLLGEGQKAPLPRGERGWGEGL